MLLANLIFFITSHIYEESDVITSDFDRQNLVSKKYNLFLKGVTKISLPQADNITLPL